MKTRKKPKKNLALERYKEAEARRKKRVKKGGEFLHKNYCKKRSGAVRDTTVVVAVGCGGIFYHGLSRMVTFCNRRVEAQVSLVDPDKVEVKNVARQWTGDLPSIKNIGAFKVRVAQRVLLQLGITCSVYERKVERPKDILTLINTSGDYKRHYERFVRVVVVCSPDNHLCRVNVHKGCGLLASETGVEVCEITAGNGPDYGYAYGCVHVPHFGLHTSFQIGGGSVIANPKGDVRPYKCVRDWTKYHPDIVSEAKLEARRLRHPASCGAMEEKMPGQTMVTNQLTALCVWDLAEMMVASDQVGEVYWTREKDPRVEGNMISVVRAKLTERA